ncbi:uncharacterized protein [Pseudorasbora parva]|uniref:uncharacterized protein n=1 Tax=Pseudorasbora parva TaxID=51549 RepID=UPI00351EA9AF
MISPRITCFVYFALLLGTAHANSTANTNITDSITHKKETTTINAIKSTISVTNTSVTMKPTSEPTKTQQSVCTPATPEPTKGQCIFVLPTGDSLQLVVVALTVGCFILLLTTLICASQVCHLRGIISRLHLCHSSFDLRAIREKSKSPHRNEDQVDGQPTETCVMLSEGTTAQEESTKDEESVLGEKTEENKDTEQPSTMKDPNGDVTQENSHETDAKAPESSETGV